MKKMLGMVAVIGMALVLSACPNPPKTAAATLADAQIALKTAVQASDNALDAACVDVRSVRCGRMLDAHTKALAAANTGYDAFKTGRTQLTAGNDAGAMQAAQIINSVVQEINKAVQAAAQGG